MLNQNNYLTNNTEFRTKTYERVMYLLWKYQSPKISLAKTPLQQKKLESFHTSLILEDPFLALA